MRIEPGSPCDSDGRPESAEIPAVGRAAGPAGCRVTVFKYAVIKGELPDEVVAEIKRAHDLRNRLVEIEKDHQRRVADLWANTPPIAAAVHRLEAAERTARVAVQAAGEERQSTRRAAVSPPVAAAVKAARAERSDAKAEVKRLKTALFAGIEPQLRQLRDRRKAAIKEAYRDAVGVGLYWATVNEAIAAHRTAVQQVRSTRTAGRSAELRFRRWDGSGTIAVQLQRPAGAPRRSPAELASPAGRWRNVVSLRGYAALADRERRAVHRGRKVAWDGLATLRIGSGQHSAQVALPVVMHRPLPQEADVTRVLLTRERVAGDWEASISVVARVPAPAPPIAGAVVALHVGWRAAEGGIRAGVVVGAEQLELTGELRAWLRPHDGWAEIVVPDGWVRGWERLGEVRARRDRAVAALRGWLLERMGESSWLGQALDPGGQIPSWRSAREFARLALRVRDMRCPADGEPDLWALVLGRLAQWRRHDALLWEWHARGRRRLVRRRRSAYQQIAARLAAAAAVIVVEGWGLAALSRRPQVEDLDSRQLRIARAHRAYAAPGVLRQAVTNAAAARGVAVVTPSQVAVDVHVGCGGVFDRDERARAAVVRCPACGQRVDQDVSAAQLLVTAAAAAGG